MFVCVSLLWPSHATRRATVICQRFHRICHAHETGRPSSNHISHTQSIIVEQIVFANERSAFFFFSPCALLRALYTLMQRDDFCVILSIYNIEVLQSTTTNNNRTKNHLDGRRQRVRRHMTQVRIRCLSLVAVEHRKRLRPDIRQSSERKRYLGRREMRGVGRHCIRNEIWSSCACACERERRIWYSCSDDF